MKRNLILLISLILILTGCGAKQDREELRVYNWGEYIDESKITQFEKKFNAKVIYDRFTSNEQMYHKLQDGTKYDVLIPSDYMIQRMIEENKLQKLDKSLIPNAENVMSTLKGLDYDPTNEYSMPYFWGNVGILYNKDKVDIKDLENDGWNIFLNTKYKDRTYFYDSERDGFLVALKALGYSANSSDPKELEEAYNWLKQMMETMQPVFAMDEIVDYMGSGLKDLAVLYSGDATLALLDNDKLDYYVPKEGTNLWTDAMVIPENAPNPKLAHEWINFMLEAEISQANSEEVAYTSPIESVVKDLTSEGGMFYEVDSYHVRTGYDKDEIFKYDETLKQIMGKFWSEIKALR